LQPQQHENAEDTAELAEQELAAAS
jgi:hypothetical protein